MVQDFEKFASCVTAVLRLSVCVCVCFQGMSETFSTLHGLVNKGVNVVMDIPYELWNETSAEVAELKKQVLSPEFTGMSENPSSNNIYVKCIFLRRETNCGAPTAVEIKSVSD